MLPDPVGLTVLPIRDASGFPILAKLNMKSGETRIRKKTISDGTKLPMVVKAFQNPTYGMKTKTVSFQWDY